MGSAYLEQLEKIMPERVLNALQAQKRYGENTLGLTRSLQGAVLPKSVQEIQALLQWANKHLISLYPFSIGHNWGYGSALPVKDHCLIVDLSLLNQIQRVDPILGLVTLEPGVTQQQLYDYLEHHKLPYWVPTTGAGPNTSLLGNALERGHGLTPHIDHFAAVTSLEAVLPSGEIYKTPLTQLAGETIDKAYKWGVGPYLDGLFSQGNFGIVTSITLQLVRKPSYQEMVLFHLPSNEAWVAFVDELRDLIQIIGNNLGAIKISNLSMNHQPTAWFAVSSIYGERPVVKAVRKVICKKLHKKVSKLQFVNMSKLKMQFLKPYLSLWEGKPNDAALRVTYHKMHLSSGNQLNPDTDGCGLIWFAPLIPMLKEQVKNYITTVEEVLKQHHFSPELTFSCLSGACFSSSVPILYNRKEEEEVQRAHACYEALFLACQRLGILPYRYPIHFLEKISLKNSSYGNLAAHFKKAVDPLNILAPGRYEF